MTRVLRFRDGHLPLERAVIMGIVNVTPDSFSDGGRFLAPALAVEHAIRLAGEGAEILDIGGESTRPGADPVPADEEWRRVRPVLAALRQKTRRRTKPTRASGERRLESKKRRSSTKQHRRRGQVPSE